MHMEEHGYGAWMEEQCTPYINIVPITRSPGSYRSWTTTTTTTMTGLPTAVAVNLGRRTNSELPGPAFRDPRWGLGRWKSERVPTKRQTRRAIIYDVYRVGFVRVARSAISQHPPRYKQLQFSRLLPKNREIYRPPNIQVLYDFLNKKDCKEWVLLYFSSEQKKFNFHEQWWNHSSQSSTWSAWTM